MRVIFDFCAFWWFSQFHTCAAPSEESFKDIWLRADSRADDLERRLRNALQHQKRTKLTVLSLVEELKENMLTEDLQSRLDAYSGRPSINSLDTYMTTKIIFISSIATILYMIIVAATEIVAEIVSHQFKFFAPDGASAWAVIRWCH